MVAFIALGLGANVMLTCTLLPSTCLTDSNPFIHLAVTEGVSTSIAWVADTELQGFIAVVTELVWVNFLRGCKANAIGAAASRAADATVDLVALGAVKSIGNFAHGMVRRGFLWLCLDFYVTRRVFSIFSTGQESAPHNNKKKAAPCQVELFLFFVWFSLSIFCFVLWDIFSRRTGNRHVRHRSRRTGPPPRRLPPLEALLLRLPQEPEVLPRGSRKRQRHSSPSQGFQ